MTPEQLKALREALEQIIQNHFVHDESFFNVYPQLEKEVYLKLGFIVADLKSEEWTRNAIRIRAAIRREGICR